VDPSKVLSPLLLIRGEYDGIATVDARRVTGSSFCPVGRIRWVSGVNRRLFWHTLRAFLTMPAPPVPAA